MTRFFLPQTPRLFAHRGDNVRYPENTLQAFRAAVERGLRYLEMDVWMSSDHMLVVHHDRTTLRTCGVETEIPETEFTRIRELDPGWGFVDSRGERPFAGKGIRIPALEEVLEAFPQTLLTLEIKQDTQQLPRKLLSILREAQALDRVLIASHQDGVVRQVREMEPEIPTSFGYEEIREFILGAQEGALSGYNPPASALQIPPRHEERELVTPEVVRTAKQLGVEIHVWTVNEEEYARSLLQMGVEGIMSDDAEMLGRLMEKRSSGAA